MTLQLKVASHPTQDVVVPAAKAGTATSEPVSITVGPTPTNFVHRFGLHEPLTYRDFFTVAGVSGSRVTLYEDTTGFDARADGFGDGASVRAYRITAGALVLAATTTLTTWHARRWNRLTNDYVPAATTTFRYRFDSYNRPNFSQWWGVCAMDASGNLGPIAYATASSGALTGTQPAAPSNTLATDISTGSSAIGGSGPAAPTNVTATAENDGWIINVSWTNTPGATGHVVFRCDYDPTTLLTNAFDLADASAVQAGDILIVSKEFSILATRGLERAERATSRTWSANPNAGGAKHISLELFPFSGDRTATITQGEDAAEGYYRRHVWDGVSGRTGMEMATHSGTSQSFYHVLVQGQEYAVECRARGTGTLRLVALAGADPAAGTSAQQDYTLTSEWQTFSLVFTPSSTQTSSTARAIQAQLVGSGTVDIVWLAPRQTHTALGRATAADIARTENVSLVRDHEHIKSKPWSNTFASVTSGGAQAPLARFLRFCADIGSSPWFQHEWVWSEADWAAFAEYVLAPYNPVTDTPQSKPWAYRRYSALGWGESVVDRFPQIMFEVGNENWNTTIGFYTIPALNGQSGGTVNGLWLDYVVGLIEASPHWQSSYAPKWRNYLGGWATQIDSGWSADSAEASVTADLLGPADYNGVSWDNGATQTADPEDDAAWDYTIGNSVLPVGGGSTDRRHKAQRFTALCDAVSVGRAKPLRPAIYEAGPGYMLDGLNDASVDKEQAAAQEFVMKSVGAGTATLDAFLIQAANGCALNNFFMFRATDTWSSHATPINGGASNPPWMWTRWLNVTFPAGFTAREATPFVRPAEDFDASALKAGTLTTGADPVGVFRLDGGGKTALVVCNRSPRNAYDIAVSVPGATGALSLVAMDGTGTTVDVPTGDDIATRREIVIPSGYKAVNNTAASASNVTLTTTPLTYTDRIEATIPPGLARAWVWS